MDDPAVATRETEDEARDRMEQLMRRSKIGLLEVEQRLGVQGNVIAMYVLGSRLWGSATDTSDYDLVLVANQREPHRTLHWGNVDALVYSPEEWQRLLDAHYVYGLVCTRLSGPWVWRTPPANAFRAVNINRLKLLTSVREEIDRDWRMVVKWYQKDQTDRAQKTLCHALRLCLLATELAETGVLHRLCSLSSDPVLSLPYEAYTLEDAIANVQPILYQLCARLTENSCQPGK